MAVIVVHEIDGRPEQRQVVACESVHLGINFESDALRARKVPKNPVKRVGGAREGVNNNQAAATGCQTDSLRDVPGDLVCNVVGGAFDYRAPEQTNPSAVPRVWLQPIDGQVV